MNPTRTLAAIGLSLLAAATLHAQENQRPKNFKVRYDSPKADDAKTSFVTMTPGWHVTTGPNSGILYDPANSATGTYTAEAKIHLFKPTVSHPEAYGLFVGGKALDGDGQSYLYFLLRTDGKYLVKQRTGKDVKEVVAPAASPAVKPYADGKESVANVLAIKVGAENVDFLVNGTTVASRPRKDLQTDGIVGLRANHSLNLHVESLKVSK
ncbi:MAG TPA: hypothetical protein VFX50_03485 [Gemmatimonadales bacterium]|nr:hypothetical protein [Gemmatimonadales bacterium]